MSSPYTAALVDLRTWRDHVEFLIASLEKLEGGVAIAGMPPAAAAAPQRAAVPAAAARSSKPASAKVAPAKTENAAAVILAAMAKTARPVSLKELIHETKLTTHLMREGVRVLGKRKELVITGAGRGKRVALPAIAAKEGL